MAAASCRRADGCGLTALGNGLPDFNSFRSTVGGVACDHVDGLARFVDLFHRDIEVGDGADAAVAFGEHADAAVRPKRSQKSAAAPSSGGTRKKTMFVSTRSGSSSRPGAAADGLGEPLGLFVVFGQAVDVVFEGVECPGRDDAGLTHAAAEDFAMPAGLADHFGGAAECRADRRAEALAETDADRVEMASPIGGQECPSRRRR